MNYLMKIDREYIDKLSNCNPDEFDKLLESKSIDDLLQLKDFVRIMDENHSAYLSDGNIRPYYLKTKELYNDLIKEGKLKIDYFTFDCSTLETMQDAQARKEIIDKRETILKGVDYEKYFLLMNEIYSTLFEKICSTCLTKISETIQGFKNNGKGNMVRIVKKYKNDKYNLFFQNIRADIRNSISHEDFYIDKKLQKIFFYNNGVNYLILQKSDYEGIFLDLFYMQIGFDRAKWELTKTLEYDLISRMELVSDYLKNKGLSLTPSKTSKISVYDYSEMIKKGLI